MHTSLFRCACILFALHGLASALSPTLQKRRASKIDEFNNADCTTTYPDGTTNNQPTYHHSPPVDECIGIDPSTLSVRIVTGTWQAPAWGYYTPGVCDSTCSADIVFDSSVDGGSECHPVERISDLGLPVRVHDVQFQAFGAIMGDC